MSKRDGGLKLLFWFVLVAFIVIVCLAFFSSSMVLYIVAFILVVLWFNLWGKRIDKEIDEL